MKILIMDDQQLVLLSLQKTLTDLGYEVISADNIFDAVQYYDIHKPDLAIIDINMSVTADQHSLENTLAEINDKSSGLEVLKYIRYIKEHNTPVMILTGNTDDDIIEKGFELGANEYMKKPLSLKEIGIRVKRLIGGQTELKAGNNNRYIQNSCVGVVIPCYNEEAWLLSDEFRNFVFKNLGYHLCFVNDGSTDGTLEVLRDIQKENRGRISIYNCKKNVGRAEAIRLGMMSLEKQKQFDYIGFMDADLSTNFQDFSDLVKTITHSKFKVVSGCRISRMGADISTEPTRKFLNRVINYTMRKVFGLDFRDAQCGVKIMSSDVVEIAFGKRFLTKSLFDVEILLRLKKIYGGYTVKQMWYEKPLDRWIYARNTKVSVLNSFSLIGQLGQITLHYR
ncbi:glycosyltransferase [Flavobacterium beibuense]|uniref:Transcriptional regulator n=1 Tax=Flavobacterium beibuense F44-8 TaxID=1406840 RepID=A0A0A2LG87_9FLAO|nr:glycosyltransferase [Flavobacterium beibuense]KGO79157.1 transcriptional regulator [Flavobacterium beibuense F44-8]